jgi:hypothetical protein
MGHVQRISTSLAEIIGAVEQDSISVALAGTQNLVTASAAATHTAVTTE